VAYQPIKNCSPDPAPAYLPQSRHTDYVGVTAIAGLQATRTNCLAITHGDHEPGVGVGTGNVIEVWVERVVEGTEVFL
jgi:hypothetical protein